MGDLSKHFSRAEFACKCGCGFDTVDAVLLGYLESIRTYFGAPITINSGCRCSTYNAKIGGESKSLHMAGRAADITVLGTPPADVARYAELIGCGGIGKYDTFTHVDSRTKGPARWAG